jgi:hypothetical protein
MPSIGAQATEKTVLVSTLTPFLLRFNAEYGRDPQRAAEQRHAVSSCGPLADLCALCVESVARIAQRKETVRERDGKTGSPVSSSTTMIALTGHCSAACRTGAASAAASSLTADCRFALSANAGPSARRRRGIDPIRARAMQAGRGRQLDAHRGGILDGREL